MSHAGATFDGLAEVKQKGAEMSAEIPARIFVGHQRPISAFISAPESS
jgi:hypothetical protein